ncbi:MAG: hypothetical protein HYU66_17490 [Armatimonadetes bacterium]|nr:hypothetical protein [Armatimonadota bacterium]
MSIRPRWFLLALPALAALAVGDAPREPLTIVVCGLTQDYLEACGCGGQTAGGLARRVGVIKELRAEMPGLVLIDAGDLGVKDQTLAVIARSLAAAGVDAVGMAGGDLGRYATLAAAARLHALPFTSLATPAPPVPGVAAPPGSVTIERSSGWRVGVVSLAHSPDSVSTMAARCAAELKRLKAAGCQVTVLISHLGDDSIDRLMATLQPRPDLILYATSQNFPGMPEERGGCWWVPISHRGRSVGVISVSAGADGLDISVAQSLLARGPIDPVVQGWVDGYYQTLRAGQVEQTGERPAASYPAPSECEKCHAASVAAWRKHPHAHAVETLEERGRDVAACLVCHAESLRRDGQRPPQKGDRGVECATCHQGLAEHLKDATRHPTSAAEKDCVVCHNAENSAHFTFATYRGSVVKACRGGGGGDAK